MERMKAWRDHYSLLLNVEFPWNPEGLQEQDPVQGPPILISEEMVTTAINSMKKNKAAGPSGIAVEMIRAAGPSVLTMITNLVNLIIQEGKIPEEWNLSFIINYYKGKGDSLERGNYRGLKVLDQVLKIVEHVFEAIIRKQVDIDSMQFGFMLGKGTTDTIFILKQLHEKHISKKKDLYFMLVDLEKAFDRVPRRVLWWAMRKIGVEEWVVHGNCYMLTTWFYLRLTSFVV